MTMPLWHLNSEPYTFIRLNCIQVLLHIGANNLLLLKSSRLALPEHLDIEIHYLL